MTGVAGKVYYTKGVFCSSKAARKCTKSARAKPQNAQAEIAVLPHLV
jgi:hypothetical protein